MADITNRASIATTIVALAAVGVWLYVHRYPTGRVATPCERFSAGVAIDFIRPDWCETIPIKAERGAGDAPKGFEVDSLRSNCFLSTAIETQDTKLCSQVKPIRADWINDGLLFDGSGFNEAYCIDSVKNSRRYLEGSGLNMSNYELAPIMQQLGYTDQTLLDANLDPRDQFSWSDYIQLLLRPLPPWVERKNDFLTKVNHLRCK
jgi:hypothetical protein